MNENALDLLRNPAVLDCFRQAAEWRLVSLLLGRPVPGWREGILLQAQEVKEPQLLEAVTAAVKDADYDEGSYHTHFGPGGPAAPREISHRETLQPGQVLAEIAAFYQAFGYQPDRDEPPDHVAVEAGFVAWLYLKEAYALVDLGTARVETVRQARAQFLEEHLSNIAGPLRRSLEAGCIRHLELAARVLSDRSGCPACPEPAPLPVLPDEGCEFDGDQEP